MTESHASATERVGRYQLLEPVGNGPTGAVWRAKVFGVAGFERQFAVKRFLPEVTATPPAAQSLSAGARAYGSLEHPRIARMTEFGVAQGQTFTAVEFVVGLDVMRLMAEAAAAGAPLLPGGALGLVSQVARAIGYAHGRGISHLGLAPTNVIVTPDGDVKVTDFAILAATLPAKPADAPRLAGRIAYLAPEQLAAEATSAATDVFALGVLAYELVTGQRTFRGETPQQVAQAIMAGPPPEPALPRPIVRVLQRCLARSPFERFPDARAFADALDAALRVAPVPGTRKDIGAQVKVSLDRLAELRETQMSGMLALRVGTGPVSKLAPSDVADHGDLPPTRTAREQPDYETEQYVRPDLEVPGPTPLVSPALGERPETDFGADFATEIASASGDDLGGATRMEVRSTSGAPTTAPGLAPPPIPAPRQVPSIPAIKRPESNSPIGFDDPTRVGGRIGGDVAAVPSIGGARPASPAVPAVIPPVPARVPAVVRPPTQPPPVAVEAPRLFAPLPAEAEPAETLGAELSSVAAELAALDHIPALDEPAAADALAALDGLDGLDEPSHAEQTLLRPRSLGEVGTDPGVGIRPTAPALPPPPAASALGSTVFGVAPPPIAAEPPRAAPSPSAPPPFAPSAPSVSAPSVSAPSPTAPGGATLAPPLARPLVEPSSRVSQPIFAVPNPEAPLHLTVTPAPATTGPRRWPWVVGGVLVLGGLAGGAYVVLGGTEEPTPTVTAPRGPEDAATGSARVAQAPDAAAARPTPPDASAAPAADATALATAPIDAAPAVDAVAVVDAVVAVDASARPVDAAVAVDASARPVDAAAPPADAATPTPTPTSGDTLTISSTPGGAHLYVDGAEHGVTPQTLPGVPGRHTAALLLTGYDLYVGELDGHGAFALPLKAVTPAAGPAGIKVIKCVPNRYYVYVDDKPTGQLCPTERINCSVGAHTVEVYDAVTAKRRKWDIQVVDTRLSFRVRVE